MVKNTQTRKNNKTKRGNQTRKNKNLFFRQQCSPKTYNENNNSFSCYSTKTLYKMKSLWNIKHPDNLITGTTPRKIWIQFKLMLNKTCNKESCWIQHNFLSQIDKNKIITTSFAPESPDEWINNPNAWLSNHDITRVMKQYESTYKCFDFIGPSPIDYDTILFNGDCVWDELCNFSIDDQIKNKKTKIGIIFNLDPHNLGGSHWVSLFINIKKKTIFYFNSTGNKIPIQIKKFVDMVIKQGKKPAMVRSPIIFSFDQNYPQEHQYSSSECGMYSLYFIVQMLEDKLTQSYLKTHIIPDDHVQKFRRIYFNKYGDL
jgi:hypothetical protein